MRILLETLGDLWRLLDARGKGIAALMVVVLMISSVIEMSSVIFLFGYIAALADTGETGNPAVTFYRAVAGDLEGPAFAAAAGAVLIAIFVVKNAIGLLTSFYLLRFAMKRYEVVSGRLFEGYLETRLDLFNQRGLLLPQQVLSSVQAVFRMGFNPALEALSDIAVLVAMFAVLLLVIDPWLVLGACVILGGGGGAVLGLARRMIGDLGHSRMSSNASMMQLVNEGFRGLIDIRLGHRVGAMIRRHDRAAGEFALAERRIRGLEMTPRALNEVLLAGGIVAAGLYFSSTAEGMQEALPAFAAMGLAGLRMTGALSRLSTSVQLMRGTAAERARMMAEIRDTAPGLLEAGAVSAGNYRGEVAPSPGDGPSPLRDRITVADVRYSFPASNTPVLSDISLEIPSGSFIGLCGSSGSGKSTLALLIMGLLRPEAGAVRCDGRDVFADPRDWHRQIGYVAQTPFIAPRSVRENVALGCEARDIDDRAVWRALDSAALAPVIRDRPEGLEAMLGDEGVLLSGGQRQRLGIARALYRDPGILVFDEATAALDTATEREVAASIAAMRSEKTVICIAHRLTTIQNADMIHVLEAGRIVASGTYEELEAGSEVFRQLAHGQRGQR